MRRPVLLLALAIALTGCGRFQAPTLELAFRDSLVGAGKIVRIENASSQPLTGLEIEVTTDSGESRSFVLDRLEGYDTLELGWKKLGGWQVPAGAAVEVRADGFFFAFRGELPLEEATQ